jgi:glycosyltransferase involved in cell wall biosynthesis
MTAAIVAAGGRALVVSEGGRMAPDVKNAGGELIPFRANTKNPARMLLNVGRLASLISENNVDLVHARSRAPAWSAWLAARRTKRPFVTTYHGAYAEKTRLKRAYNRIMARGDIVIANSHYTARLIQARYGTPQSRIRVIHRGIDEAAFDPALVGPGRVAKIRQDWGVPDSRLIILLAARLTDWKGQSILIDAAARLRALGALDDAVAILAGDAQGRAGYVESLNAQIARLELGNLVRLPGHVTDMPAAYLAAHVAVVASTEPEAFGRVAAEAEAMGCPVIATNIGAAPETIRAAPQVPAGEATGWLVPPGNSEALAQQLRLALALAPSERSAIGARARHHVANSFSLAAMQRATLEVYNELIGSTLALP